MAVLGPDAFVHAVAEVRSFLWEYRAITLATLVLLESSAYIAYARIVHRYKDVFALRSIEALEGEPLIGLCRNVRPEQVLVVLWRFYTTVHILAHSPSIAL